jgi:hypothetical protein
VEQLEHRWCPSFSLVTSRTALAGTDSVNWGTLPTVAPANPFTILSTGGRSISVSKTIADTFRVVVECPSLTGCGWDGNFAPGDSLLLTNDLGSKLVNPITLNFGTTAVAAGGAQIQSGVEDPFTANVEAFDAAGNSLAHFQEHGISTGAEDNSAIFIGISSSSANISQIALSTQAGDQRAAFAINKFDFRTTPLAAVTPAAAPAVGQPASSQDPALPAFSLLSMNQPALLAAPHSGPATPSAAPASQSGLLPTARASSPAPARATDAVFAASHPATNDDGTWLFAQLSFGSLDAM